MPFLSDLNLGDADMPLPGYLPPSESQWSEVLQQTDQQVTCHEEAATQAVPLRMFPCRGIAIEVQQQDPTMFF